MNQPKKRFIRTIEDFTCEHCGAKVTGTGYTNHCPECLYSKHVDLEVPGDRENPCQGLMKPVDFEIKNGAYFIFQRCEKCGETRRIKTAKDDNFETLLALSRKE